MALIVLTGGSETAVGNITSCAEFNIFYDPEAGAEVRINYFQSDSRVDQSSVNELE